MALITSYRDLDVYQGSLELAVGIFQRTKTFPPEERYSLTDQVRRCSRSVCANLAEAWRKRRYPAAFVSKLNDAEAEAAETQVWLELALRFQYLNRQEFARLDDAYEKVLGQLVRMAANPEKWVIGDKRAGKPLRPLADSPTRRLP